MYKRINEALKKYLESLGRKGDSADNANVSAESLAKGNLPSVTVIWRPDGFISTESFKSDITGYSMTISFYGKKYDSIEDQALPFIRKIRGNSAIGDGVFVKYLDGGMEEVGSGNEKIYRYYMNVNVSVGTGA